ncbi:MAG: DUF1292 domain-containing protein [Candidatus Izemoplasmatales bacterium]|jgi:uncharacterized protein YrzB (UPF0473 family)|nr:DUF1292 domain-containing protein [Candidatus Izemoplasmatales bacterium]
MEKEYLLVTDEDGNEIECEIIMTFTSEEYSKSYVVYQIKDDESGEYYAASYNPDDGDEGKLLEVESDEEWDLIEEVLESFLEENEEEEAEEEPVSKTE